MNTIAMIVGYLVIIGGTIYFLSYCYDFAARWYLYNFIIGPCWQMESERRMEHKHMVKVIDRIQNATSN